jgi:nucleoside-diphosphate-sugar epimerase
MGAEAESPVLLGVARFGEVFGPRDRRESRVVPRTITALLRDEQPRADGGPSRDFICVRDAARACISIAEAVGLEQSPQDATFRSGWQHTDREMIDLVKAAFAGDRLADREPEPPLNPFGWQPATAMGDALAETIAWQRATRPEVNTPPVRGRKAA